MRQVPAHIDAPEYVGRKRPRIGEPDVKDPDTIARMRVAGRIAAQALAEVGRHVAPGVTTDELDRVGHEFLIDHGAYPSTLGYRGYPKSLCTSLNEVICHGIPDDTVIADGDIVNVDITAYIGGVHGDTNATFLAGAVDEESRLLVERTHEAMMRGIRSVAPGRPLNANGRVIESYARRFGYGVVRDFTGHGIGTTFHSGLIVPHFDDPDVTVIMEPGMTFTIEPMLTLGTISYDIWADGWTAVTTHPARAATHVTWAAQAGSVIQPNQTVVFGLQVGPLPAKPSISFDALQTYSDGSLVDWNQPTIGATPPQFPAPVVKVAGAPAAAAPDEVKPGVATVQGSSTQATTAAESGAAMLPIVLGTAGVLVLAVLVFVVRRRKAA